MSSEDTISLGGQVRFDDNVYGAESSKSTRRNPRNDAATGASAAGVRAVSAQVVAFYFRAPVKAFFRTRVDYMVRIPVETLTGFSSTISSDSYTHRARHELMIVPLEMRWSLHTTTPGLLVHAVRTYGWRFIPNQLLPPMLANAGIGAVLYTSYLQTLGILYEPVSRSVKRIYPPASPVDTFAAGFAAGTVQSVVAAPLDALQVRLRTNDMLHGQYRSMWHYGQNKLKEIGLRGIFAGWSLSLLRDSFGYAVFFSDLAEQLADVEEPLQNRLRNSLDCETASPEGSRAGLKRQRRVRYIAQSPAGRTDLEKISIDIPSPAPRRISRIERSLAIIMSPSNRHTAQIHGLVGKPLLYFTSVFVSLGVFLFGYDQGVMSGIITGWHFKDYFNQPSRAAIGTVVAILEVGAFISSLLIGRIGDLIGRRKTILYGSIVFSIGGAFQTFATGLPMMMLGRIVAGLGVGALSTIVPVYQSEISPPHNRGKLACIEFTGNICGYAASVWVDYFCSYIDSNYAWRLPLLCQCIMGTLLGLGSLIICESPRWLLDNDHDEEGMVVIANLYGQGDLHNDKARQEYREIKMDVLLQRQEGERSYTDMFKRYRKRVLIAMSAQALAQLNGINVISYYAPLVFESAGWAGRAAILMTGINGLSYLASTVPPWYLVDRWGRRPILLSGAVAMIISLSLISYFIYIDVAATPTLTVIFVMIYNASFGASWGPIPWLYPPEILPLSIRAKGASLSTATNWAFNWLVGEVTPVLQAAIKWRLYLVHAFFCACSFVLVYFLYPETSGVRLEDMDVLFGDATTAVPTPATQAERGSLMSGGSPVPSLDIRRQYGQFGTESAIPGLDIDPPNINTPENSKAAGLNSLDESSGRPEGIGGWISNMVSRHRAPGPQAKNNQYRRLGQEEGEND
ncbi:sugar transporter STL1 [Aspergillus lentulus]|uniref:Sugar transporter STL1 n=2 Tax=Aspergillus lentulus TaxID=293939 RepID=A0AAN4PQQ5_ASPLE|nr:hypothetical protein CNMCM6069_008005 [Aspergillus lentulus]KAF4165595.1 hypothetical protein CNMCM6936_007738 [Aspergillus lentulus]KAF4174917.1 hypothetical protein CNMCM8060_007928 [Aspergillus lentulus]KAF4184061.1 hypothetical protein CNMCM7927_008354 [Aspergillus lentulus]KAF4194173.1 hypothetical protein CNMCM8694_007948 [Aspergillus lentulus]